MWDAHFGGFFGEKMEGGGLCELLLWCLKWPPTKVGMGRWGCLALPCCMYVSARSDIHIYSFCFLSRDFRPEERTH